jgi:hypothetical protein
MAIWPGLITLDTDIFSTHLILESSSKTTKTKTYLTVNSVCRFAYYLAHTEFGITGSCRAVYIDRAKLAVMLGITKKFPPIKYENMNYTSCLAKICRMSCAEFTTHRF